MEQKPSTQQTYSESDLAPITELINISQQRGRWSKLAGWTSNIINNAVNATVDVVDTLFLGSGISGHNLNIEWGQDHSGRGIEHSYNKLLYFNKTAVGNDEDLAEAILTKVKNSGLLELAEMAGRNTRVCQSKVCFSRKLKRICSRKRRKRKL